MRDRRPEAPPVRLRDREPSLTAESPEAANTRTTARARRAAARTVLCCAGVHVLILFVSALTHRDASVFNVFTMLEAQRLWPALAQSPAAPWWSLAALLALYGAAYGTLARDGSARLPAPRAHAGRALAWWRNAAARLAVPAGIVAPGFASAARTAPARAHDVAFPATGLLRVQPSLRDGLLMLVAGLALHMTSLAAIERFVSVFPPVPDVLHANLPYVDFGPPGELVYAAFLVAIVTVLLRRQPRSVPAILFLLGVFYGLRGAFLFLLPIGIPPTAPPLEARFVLWPFAGHAYFPGGHTGMMTLLSLSVASAPWRRAFLVVTFAFALGTLLSRTHYTADVLGGWCIGYAIVLWGRGHVIAWPPSFSARRETAWSAAPRPEQEV